MWWWLGLLLLLLGATHSGAAPARAYTFVDLGHMIVLAQSSDDEVIVVGMQDGKAVVLREGEPLQVVGLADSRALGARKGLVVGHAQFDHIVHAVRFREGRVEDLGALHGSPASSASCVTDAEAIGGVSSTAPTTPLVPVLWSKDGTLQQLATLGGGSVRGVIDACNGPGVLVGMSDRVEGPPHATAWRPPGYAPEDLHTLPGATFSRAFGVNDTGEVVGVVMLREGSARGFRWHASTGMVVLPPLDGDTGSKAKAINNGGDIVGSSWNLAIRTQARSQSHATLWGEGGVPTPLQSLVSGNVPWPLREAIGIGPHGVIVVTGDIDSEGDGRKIATPVAGLLVPMPRQ